MISAFKNSSAKRREALEEKRKHEDEKKSQKRKIREESQILKSKRQRALETLDLTRQEIDSYDRELKKIENQQI